MWNSNLQKETITDVQLRSAEHHPVCRGKSLAQTVRQTLDTIYYYYLLIQLIKLDFMRSLHITRKGKQTTHIMWEGMDTKSSITRNLNNRTRKWYGHIERMAEDLRPKKIIECYSPRLSNRDMPTTKRETCVQRIMNNK